MLVACRSKERAPDPPSPPPPPLASTAAANEAEAPLPAKPFLEMYVAGWSLRDRPASGISFEGVSDAILFSVLPKPDGSLDATTNGLTDERIAAVRDRAKKSGARVLVAVGGEKTASRFKTPGIASSLATFVKKHDLDGVVLDPEPLVELSHEAVAALAHDVKDSVAPRMVTMVVAPDPKEIATLGSAVGDLDRVTVMSYLGEPTSAKEAALVDSLVTLGFDRARIGLGIGPKTLIEARENRLARVRERQAGGIALWAIMDSGGLRP